VARLVDKQYVEDIDEDAGFNYRYWELVDDDDDEQFRVRISPGEPDNAYVAATPHPVDNAQHAALRALARFVAEHENGAKLHVIGDSGGYEELEAAIERKLARESRASGASR
jgi:hypothetical protein